MTLNIANLDRLISHLEGVPEERFNMGKVFTNADGRDDDRSSFNQCGTAACIAGWALVLIGKNASGSIKARHWLGLDLAEYQMLFMPDGFDIRPDLYPLSRAIRTLKHMRSEYLRTGEVVVDWDASEPVALKEWTAPKAAERVLPEEIVSLLRMSANSEVSA